MDEPNLDYFRAGSGFNKGDTENSTEMSLRSPLCVCLCGINVSDARIRALPFAGTWILALDVGGMRYLIVCPLTLARIATGGSVWGLEVPSSVTLTAKLCVMIFSDRPIHVGALSAPESGHTSPRICTLGSDCSN